MVYSRSEALRRQKVCPEAAEKGDLDAVKLAVEQGFPYGTQTCAAAAAHGHLHILEWMEEELGVLEVRVTAQEAARTGDLPVLQWLLEQLYEEELEDGALDPAWSQAVELGNIDVLEWLRDRAPTPSLLCETAAEHGQLASLKWLLDDGEWLTDGVYLRAARRGHFDLLQWLLCDIDVALPNGLTCLSAARKGRLDVVRALRERQAPWGRGFCSKVHTSGQYHVLKWALDNGCTWEHSMCSVPDCPSLLPEGSTWCRSHGDFVREALERAILPDIARLALGMLP